MAKLPVKKAPLGAQHAEPPTVKGVVEGGQLRIIAQCEAADAESLGLGSVSAPFASYLVGQLVNLTVSGELPKGALDMEQANALLRLASSFKPETEYEAAVAVQMAMLHHMALDCGRRAMNRGATMEGRALNLSQAGKLARSSAMLLDALSRHRGKTTSQTVRVEHVTIHGGQTVVGAVTGRGGYGENDVQSYGCETDNAAHGGAHGGSRRPALPGPQPIGPAVSTAGVEGQEALPHARRRGGDRCAKGKPEPSSARSLQRGRKGGAADGSRAAAKRARSERVNGAGSAQRAEGT